MTDAELADSILRKIAADGEACILIDRGVHGDSAMCVIDAGWNVITLEEAAYLERIIETT